MPNHLLRMRRGRGGHFVAFAAAAALVAAGCSSTKSATPPPSSSSPGAPTASGPVTVTDKDGNQVTVTAPAKRVACLSVTCVDVLAELGLTPVSATKDGKSLAADPHYFGPTTANGIANIGGTFSEPSIEDVIASKPDLIVTQAQRYEKFTSALKPAAPLYFIGPGPYQDTFKQLRDIGALTARQAQAEAGGRRLTDKIAAYKAKSPGNLTPMVIIGDPKSFDLETNTSVVGSLVAAVTKYPWAVPAGVAQDGAGDIMFSLEQVLSDNPDVILLETSPSPGDQPLAQQFAANPLWSQLNAVKNHKVFEVSALFATEAQATRASGLVLDQIMPQLYPDVFPTPLP